MEEEEEEADHEHMEGVEREETEREKRKNKSKARQVGLKLSKDDGGLSLLPHLSARVTTLPHLRVWRQTKGQL